MNGRTNERGIHSFAEVKQNGYSFLLLLFFYRLGIYTERFDRLSQRLRKGKEREKGGGHELELTTCLAELASFTEKGKEGTASKERKGVRFIWNCAGRWHRKSFVS